MAKCEDCVYDCVYDRAHSPLCDTCGDPIDHFKANFIVSPCENCSKLQADLAKSKPGFSQATMNDMIRQRDAKHLAYVDEEYKTRQLRAEFATVKRLRKEADLTVMTQENEIARLKEADRWIPNTERLPKAGKQVIMLDIDTKYVYVGSMNKPGEWWYYCVNTEKTITEKEITHWKPIVLPPTKDLTPEQALNPPKPRPESEGE